MKRKMSSVVLIGRRWFRKSYGNTYHSVEIVIDGKEVAKVGPTYGYDSQWEWTAGEWMEKNGYMPDREHNERIGSCEAVWRYCERKGIQLVRTVTDVPRERDL